jgi:phosphate transport system protein
VRTRFDGELEHLGIQLSIMCSVAADAMRDATRALLERDLGLAEQVIGVSSQLHLLRLDCERHAISLLALRAPLARELRLVVSGIQSAEKIERMGDLACHVAQIARRRHPECAVPPTLVVEFARLGRLAALTALQVRDDIREPVGGHFAEQDLRDDRIDALYREILAVVQHPAGAFSVREAVDVALLARFFERFADQAVAVTRRLDYVVTGDLEATSE